MDPPTGQQEGRPKTVPVVNLQDLKPFEYRPEQPALVQEPIPLDHAVVNYFAALDTDWVTVQQLVYHKSVAANAGFTPIPVRGCEGGPIVDCDRKAQDSICNIMFAYSKCKDHEWPYTSANYGRYIASGLTQLEHLGLVYSLPADLFSKIKGLEKLFPPKHQARDLEKNKIVKAANERVLENRINLPERVEAEQKIRDAGMGIVRETTTEEQHWAAANETVKTLQDRNDER